MPITNSIARLPSMAITANRRNTGVMNCVKQENGAGSTATVGGANTNTAGMTNVTGTTVTTIGITTRTKS